MNIIIFDFETYWNSKEGYTLSKMPPVDYIRDERFYPQCLGLSVNWGPVSVYEHDDIPAVLEILDLTNPENIIIGHNSAGFDNLILSEHYGIHPACMTDTIHLMRWTGVSRLTREQLASMTKWFGTGSKRAGTLISDGRKLASDFPAHEWEDFKKYCAEDVQQTRDCAKVMLQYVTGDALIFSNLTCRMATDPKFIVDPAPLREYLAKLDRQEAEAFAKLKEIFSFSDDTAFLQYIRSAQRFADMLRQLGVEPPMKLSEKQTATRRKKWESEMQHCTPARRETIRLLLQDPENYAVYQPALSKQDLEFLELLEHPDIRVRVLVQARLDHNSSVARSRALNLLRVAESGRPMPVLFKAYYAHTSRYGAGTAEGKSDSVQLQNVPKHNKEMRPLRQSIIAPAGQCVIACDSAQIEARVLAYEAQETELLEHFRKGRDPYAELAAKFGSGLSAEEIHDGAKSGNKQAKTLRQLGKKCILSCGYGTGATKLGMTLLREGVKLDDDKAQHMEVAKQYHQIYRSSNACIVAFWKTCKNVIDALYNGAHGFFGGPDGMLFEYGPMTVCGRVDVPSIKMPTGYILRYPNLRWEDNQFVYDRPLGKNLVKTRIYGGALAENCIAEGTLVLTDNGWKPIESIGLQDLIYDGVDFVTHEDVIDQGVQPCLNVAGIFCTENHKLLVREDENGRVRLAEPLWENAPQFQRFNRREIWEVNCSAPTPQREWTMDMGVLLRLWGNSRTARKCCNTFSTRWFHSNVFRLPAQAGRGYVQNAWNGRYTFIQCLAFNAIAVQYPYLSCLSSLWRKGYKSLRSLAYVRGFLQRYESIIRCLSKKSGQNTPACFRPYRQQWRLLPRKLPLDNIQSKCQKQSEGIFRNRCECSSKKQRDRSINNPLQSTTWMAAGTFVRQTRLHEQKEAAFRESYIQKKVYDIRNCGPRHQFVVRGEHEGIIVSNCTQSLAFQILMWQACRMVQRKVYPCVNIHDSFAVVVPETEAAITEAMAVMLEEMKRVPPFTPGLPLDAEAEIGHDFTIV